MICQTCKAEGTTSRIYSNGVTVTLMGFTPYYDEEGVYHSHDPNGHTQSWRCSNGHTGRRSWLTKCPAGDYGEPTDQEST